MTLRLYTQRLNPFSQKVAIALDLKKLPFEPNTKQGSSKTQNGKI